MVMSVLVKVSSCDFNYLKKITESTQGNLSVQLKKLAESEYISIAKSFENNYPKTKLKITITHFYQNRHHHQANGVCQ